jgi:hypothetical protein
VQTVGGYAGTGKTTLMAALSAALPYTAASRAQEKLTWVM